MATICQSTAAPRKGTDSPGPSVRRRSDGEHVERRRQRGSSSRGSRAKAKTLTPGPSPAKPGGENGNSSARVVLACRKVVDFVAKSYQQQTLLNLPKSIARMRPSISCLREEDFDFHRLP